MGPLQPFTPETSGPPLPLPLRHTLPGLPDDPTLHTEREYAKPPDLLFVFLSVSVLLLRKKGKLLRFPKFLCGDRWKIKNSPKGLGI